MHRIAAKGWSVSRGVEKCKNVTTPQFYTFPPHTCAGAGLAAAMNLGWAWSWRSAVRLFTGNSRTFYLNHGLHTGHSSIEERSSGLWPAVGWYNYVTICLHQSVFSIHLVKTFYRPAYLGITQPPLSKLEEVILLQPFY